MHTQHSTPAEIEEKIICFAAEIVTITIIKIQSQYLLLVTMSKIRAWTENVG